MIVVAPFGEVVCKLEPGSVCTRVFEINDNQLLVGVGWQQQR